MTRPRLTLAIACASIGVLCGALALPVSAAPATQPAQADVDRLVAQLASDDSNVREDARAGLAAMGDAVEPQLKAVLAREHIDAQTQSAVEGLLFYLQRERDTGPTPITFTTKGGTVGEVLDAISRQAGVTARLEGQRASRGGASSAATFPRTTAP